MWLEEGVTQIYSPVCNTGRCSLATELSFINYGERKAVVGLPINECNHRWLDIALQLGENALKSNIIMHTIIVQDIEKLLPHFDTTEYSVQMDQTLVERGPDLFDWKIVAIIDKH